MSLTLRSAKGSPLTHAEVDANWGWCSPTSGSTQQNLDLKGSLDAPNTWTKGQRGAFVALTSTTNSIAVDLNLSNNFTHTLTEDTTLAAPTNAVAGQSGVIEFTQDLTASALTFDTFWYFGATTPTISTTSGAKCVVSYIIEPGAAQAICSIVLENEIYAQASRNQTWTKGQRGAFVALTSSSASIDIDLDDSNNFNHTTTENSVLAAPTHAVAGQSGIIEFTQGATARLITYNTFWKFPGGTVPTLTATVGALDVLSYTVNSAGTSATCVMTSDVK